MKITNREFLPELVVNAVTHDRYEGGTGDISVTTLISPAQQRIIASEHESELTEDAADRIWSMMGSAIHYIIENAVETMKKEGTWDDAKMITERRFYAPFRDKTLSGQIDLYDSGSLHDFKLTSVWSIKDAIENGKDEWDAQLNLQRWLMMQQDEPIEVNKLFITAFARDWNKHGKLRDQKYPPRACNIEIPVWTDNRMDSYLQERFNAHFGKHVLPCTPKECWERPTTFALKKNGRQSAVRVMDSKKDILEYALTKKIASLSEGNSENIELPADHFVEERVGQRIRCEDYCAASPFCDQYAQWKETYHPEPE